MFFQSKEEWHFPFGNIFLLFRIEIIAFLYYANEESDDIIGGFTKAVILEQ